MEFGLDFRFDMLLSPALSLYHGGRGSAYVAGSTRKFYHTQWVCILRAGLDWVCGGFKPRPRVFVQLSCGGRFSSDLAGLATHFLGSEQALRVCCGTVLCVLKLCPCRANRQTDEFAKI